VNNPATTLTLCPPKPRNPFVVPSLRRKAGAHRVRAGAQRARAQAALRRDLADLAPVP
jgi:hypothetical protein